MNKDAQYLKDGIDEMATQIDSLQKELEEVEQRATAAEDREQESDDRIEALEALLARLGLSGQALELAIGAAHIDINHAAKLAGIS